MSRNIRAFWDKFLDQVYGTPPKGYSSDSLDVKPPVEEIPISKKLTVAVVQFADCATTRVSQ